MSDVNATQVGGSHYKGTGYQHWDFVHRALDGRYLEGNITKYIARWRKKNGLQDLEKARHYLTKLIDSVSLGHVSPLGRTTWTTPSYMSPEHFCDVNGIDTCERAIILALSNWRSRKELHSIGAMLDGLIERETYADEEARSVPFDNGVSSIDDNPEEPGAGYVNQD